MLCHTSPTLASKLRQRVLGEVLLCVRGATRVPISACPRLTAAACCQVVVQASTSGPLSVVLVACSDNILMPFVYQGVVLLLQLLRLLSGVCLEVGRGCWAWQVPHAVYTRPPPARTLACPLAV
jgi:hypothetical protein